MIIVNIAGGLGNQLYQYAFGRTLAVKLNVPLKLAIMNAASQNPRPYRLKHFNIQEDFATPEDLLNIRKQPTLAERLGLKPIHRRSIVIEPENWFNPFNPGLLEIRDNSYIEGYWQSEKYFSEIGGLLRTEFTLRLPPDANNQHIADSMQNVDSVSIHVRRGDYLTRPTAVKKFSECSIEYYRSAVEKISSKVANPHFFVFSDDHQWLRENIILDYPTTIVDLNGPHQDYLDLWLMTMCRHHINANSTFSWWGAWLANHSKGMVICPKRWFNLSREENDRDAKDRIPPDWLRL